MKRTHLLDSLLLLCLATVLIWPLFRLEYLDNWPSIESTFIADARMLGNELPHPGWQPLWYCGTRFDYVYPPALRYGTALISKAANISTARAYHLYTALLYVFGIIAVYWLVRIGSGSRLAALLSSAATALLSPSFLLLTIIRHDSGYWVPQRLHVLMAYGEGPHISALSVLGAALAAAFVALRRWNPAALAAAGALCALTVANNFYGATALAILFPIAAWAVWTGERDSRVWLRAAGIAAIAFGLSAFWLTPSYLRITLLNMKWVSQPGNSASVFAAMAVIAIFCAVTWRLGSGRPERAWTIFVAGAAILLSLDVLGLFYFGFRVMGEPHRLIPELDLALILVFFEIMRRAWTRPRWRIATAILILVAFSPAIRYLRHAWSPFPRSEPLEERYEYRISKWVHDHLPGERVLPSGSVRFWFNAWFDNAQADGGSMQGMINQIIPAATWQIMQGTKAETAILWMQALGTGAAVVPDQTSPEIYHDYAHPEKFRGALPVLYDDGKGTVVYQVPRRPGIGRIVDREAIKAIGPIQGGDDEATLSKYVAVIEDAAQPAANVTWRGSDRMDIQTRATSGSAVLVQETYDPYWRAYEQGRELAVRREPVMGFMLIDVPEGDHQIQMQFHVPLENRAGQVLFVVTLIVITGLMLPARRKVVPEVARV